MKEHKYEQLMLEARRLHKETGNNALVLMDDGDEIGAYVEGKPTALAHMLRSLMEEHKPFADIVVEVAGEYVKGHMVNNVKGVLAKHQAYEKATKKTS